MIGFLVTIISFGFRFRSLDAGTEASDPNDFAVRKDCARQSQHPRPSLPCPSFATMADAPPAGQDGGNCAADLPDGASEMFFTGRLDDPNHVEFINKNRTETHG